MRESVQGRLLFARVYVTIRCASALPIRRHSCVDRKQCLFVLVLRCQRHGILIVCVRVCGCMCACVRDSRAMLCTLSCTQKSAAHNHTQSKWLCLHAQVCIDVTFSPHLDAPSKRRLKWLQTMINFLFLFFSRARQMAPIILTSLSFLDCTLLVFQMSPFG